MSDQRPRGRPRDETITSDILEATLALISEGDSSALTIEAIARRSGVSRPSIYKRWPSLAALLLDAVLEARRQALPLGSADQPFPIPETGSLAGDLEALVNLGVALFADLERGGVIQALLAEAIHSEEVARRLEETILAPDERQLRTIFQRATERGEWPLVSDGASDQDEVLVMRALIAHAIFERYILHRPFEDELTSRLAGLLAGRSGPDKP